VKPLVGISPGAFVLVVGVVSSGAGELTPTVGMSPASADIEKTKVRVNAIKNRFMDVLLEGF
jgi:hypothetical protein